MNKFPLYNVLINKVDNKDLKLAEKKDFLNKITLSENSENVHELIYVLIKFYYMDEKTNVDTLTPYGSNFNDKNEITFNLVNLPNKLKQMIYKFLVMHFEKTEEIKETEELNIQLEKETVK